MRPLSCNCLLTYLNRECLYFPVGGIPEQASLGVYISSSDTKFASCPIASWSLNELWRENTPMLPFLLPIFDIFLVLFFRD